MLVTLGNVQAIFRGYSTLFDQAYASSPAPIIDPLIMDTPSTGLEEQHNWLGSSTGIRELVDEAQINAMLAMDYTIRNKEYEETLELREIQIRADKYGILGTRISMLAADSKYFPDILAGGLLQNGFDSTGKDYTGSQFFDTNKKAYPGAVPFTNVGTAVLAAASYAAAKANLKARTNPAGRPLNLGRDLRLICSVANENTALQILKADFVAQIALNAGVPAAAAGVTNVQKGTAQLVVWPQLDAMGMENCWFLADFGSVLKPFIKQTLIPWTYYTLDNPNSEYVLRFHKFLYQIYAAMALGYGFPEVIWGSDGSTPT